MKKSTSSIIFTISVAGIFVGTQDASASEVEDQQKTTETTNETNQNDDTITQTSDKVVQTQSSANKVTNIEANNHKNAENDTKAQSKANNNQNSTSSKNADEEVDKDTQITFKQPGESNKHIQPS